MDKISLILSALLTLTLVILIAPNIIAMNRGRVLRNIALWLAIVLGLALVYQNFGPGKHLRPPAATEQHEEDGESAPPAADQGYTPPKE